MSVRWPKKVTLKEVGPRDGLQNEKGFVPTHTKIEFIRKLVASGLTYIEATAFVHPSKIPQLSDAEVVAKALPKSKGLVFSALVPNRKGLERAIVSGFQEVAIFTAASETFNQKNINASIEESFSRFREVFDLARKEKIRVRGYVSTAFVCPYEGVISPIKSAQVINRLLDMGCYEVSVGDTIGKATPKSVRVLFERLLKKYSTRRFAGHFHDTYRFAIANVIAAMELGITTFDSSAGGLGGCPYAPGASGNVATEDLVRLFENMGIKTGVSISKLSEATACVNP